MDVLHLQAKYVVVDLSMHVDGLFLRLAMGHQSKIENWSHVERWQRCAANLTVLPSDISTNLLSIHATNRLTAFIFFETDNAK